MAAAKGGYLPTFDDLSGFESLYRAHCLARRGKRNQREVIEFERAGVHPLYGRHGAGASGPCVLRDCLSEMRAFAADGLGLEFNRKTQITPLGQGIDYLGFHLYLASNGKVVRRLRQEAKRRICRWVKTLRGKSVRGARDAEELFERLRSYRAHLDHGDTYGL